MFSIEIRNADEIYKAIGSDERIRLGFMHFEGTPVKDLTTRLIPKEGKYDLETSIHPVLETWIPPSTSNLRWEIPNKLITPKLPSDFKVELDSPNQMIILSQGREHIISRKFPQDGDYYLTLKNPKSTPEEFKESLNEHSEILQA